MRTPLSPAEARQSVQITLEGHIPSKKNSYSLGKNGGMFKNKELLAALSSLEWQAKAQYRALGRFSPIEYPRSISATFYVADGRSDLDNKYVALQDVLVSAGVIVNDSIARVRRIEAVAIVTSDKRERTEIEIK